MPAPLPDELRQRAVDAYLRGEGSSKEVAELFQVSHGSLEDWGRRCKRTGKVSAKEWKRGPNPRIDEEKQQALKLRCNFDFDTQKNPLCETAPDSGTFSPIQGRAKAYPGTRHLAVARGLGSSAVVGSICAPNLKDPQAADFGYRPAINAFVEATAVRLKK